MRFVLVTTPSGTQCALNARNILDILPLEDSSTGVHCRLNIRSWHMDGPVLVPTVHLVFCQETMAEVLAQANAE